jgi:hypothetical protein
LYQGLDPDVGPGPNPSSPFSSSQRREHAEQTAILTAEGGGLTLWRFHGLCHVYIDLSPCGSCERWLTDERQEAWCVHYYSSLSDAARDVTRAKKRTRTEAFGRQMEPAAKRAG